MGDLGCKCPEVDNRQVRQVDYGLGHEVEELLQTRHRQPDDLDCNWVGDEYNIRARC